MSKPKLTEEDLQRVLDLDNHGKGDRTGAYILLWQITGSAEALRQARISSFSGEEGGDAFADNLALQKKLGKGYPGVFDMSQKVFESSVKNVEKQLPEINEGKTNINKVIFDGAQQAWDDAHLKHDFPGNVFALSPWSSSFLDGLQFSKGAVLALGELGQARRYGKSLSDFAGRPGFQTQVVRDYAGAELNIVKDERTGKTVFVGEAGSSEQRGADLLDVKLLSPGSWQELRLDEEPGLISIDEHGGIRFTPDAAGGKTLVEQARALAARARAAAAGRPKSAMLELHDMAMALGRAGVSVAPVGDRGAAGRAAAKRVAAGRPEDGAGGAAGGVAKMLALHSTFVAIGRQHMDLADAVRNGPVGALQAELARAAKENVALGIARRAREAAEGGEAGKVVAVGRALGERMQALQVRAPAGVAMAGRMAGEGAEGRSFAPVRRGGGGVSGRAGVRAGVPADGLGVAVARRGDEAEERRGTAGRWSGAAGVAARRVRDGAAAAGWGGGSEDERPAAAVPAGRGLQRAISEFLDSQARLPPSGGIAFDPRLTPAWAGRKMPG